MINSALNQHHMNRVQSFSRPLLVAFIMAATIYEYRFSKSPSVTLLEILLVIVGFFIFIDVVALGRPFYQRLLDCFSEYWSFSLFVVWSIVCAFVALPLRINLENFWLIRNIIPSILLAVALVVYVRDANAVKKLLLIYVFSCLPILAISVSQSLTGWPQLVEYNWAFDRKMDISGAIIASSYKPTGLFSHPNGLAGFLMLPIFLSIRLLVDRDTKIIIRFCAAGLVMASFYVLLHTYAKGAWFWVVSGLLMIFCIPSALDRFRGKSDLILTALVAFLLLVFSLYLYSEGFKSFGTILTRYNLWLAAFSALDKEPYAWLFGNGQIYMPALSWQYSDIIYPNAHSSQINLLLFYGVPGFVFFWGGVLQVVSKLGQVLAISPPHFRKTIRLLLVSISIYFANFWFEPHLEGGGTLAQFFMLLGLAIVFTAYFSSQTRQVESIGA